MTKQTSSFIRSAVGLVKCLEDFRFSTGSEGGLSLGCES